MKTETMAAVFTASFGSLATDDQLQSLVVALLTLAVREVFYWWKNRRKP